MILALGGSWVLASTSAPAAAALRPLRSFCNFDRYGVATVTACIKELKERGGAKMRARIRAGSKQSVDRRNAPAGRRQIKRGFSEPRRRRWFDMAGSSPPCRATDQQRPLYAA